MGNYWIDRQGRSFLRGSHDNPRNPVALPDSMILEFLEEHQQAREGLMALLPTMIGEEKERIQGLLDAHPNILKGQIYDQDREDQFQSKSNNLRVNSTNNHLPRGDENSPPKNKLIVRF